MTDRELMQMALDALDAYSWDQVQAATSALRARLAQPEQSPTNNGKYLTGYTAPPQREWQGLTDEDWHEFMRDFLPDNRYGHTRMRAVWEFSQSKLKERNS